MLLEQKQNYVLTKIFCDTNFVSIYENIVAKELSTRNTDSDSNKRTARSTRQLQGKKNPEVMTVGKWSQKEYCQG